jgi:predicted dehydrogenase
MSSIRLGLVGCGGYQRYRIRNLLAIPEIEIAALVDPDPRMIDLTRRAYPEIQSPDFKSYSEALDQLHLDAVAIATPHTLHKQQILDSFAAGCHVLCEKPLVTTVADAKAVIEARDRAGRVGMVSYQRHFQAEFRFIKHTIDSGAVGRPTFVQALLGQEWKRATAGTWRQVPELSGGGQLNDSGSHMLDILLWVTGLKAKRVSAYIDPRGTPVDIDSAVSVQFEGGALGSISVVGDAPHWYEDITVWCERGAFYLRNGKLSWTDENGNRLSCDQLTGGSTPDRNFVDAILGRATNEAPFECGLSVIELTEAAWKSAESGGTAIEIS